MAFIPPTNLDLDYLDDKDLIFRFVTPEQIFAKYFPLPLPIDVSAFYCNPLRDDDDDPGCRFYYHADSKKFYFKDFVWRNFDCIDFVMTKFRCNYSIALKIIIRDFELDNVNSKTPLPAFDPSIPTKKHKLRKQIKVEKYPRHSPLHLQFWYKFDASITSDDLIDAKIFPLKTVWINNRVFYKGGRGDFAFYYHVKKGRNYQIYNPNKFYETNKFINVGIFHSFGKHTINYNANYILIAKSYKEYYLLLRYGVNVIACASESKLLPLLIMEHLKEHFPYILTLMDNDYKGKKTTIEYVQTYGTIPLLFPKNEEKDFADNNERFGKQSMLDMIAYYKDYFNLTD